jgi:hypothetical protein
MIPLVKYTMKATKISVKEFSSALYITFNIIIIYKKL